MAYDARDAVLLSHAVQPLIAARGMLTNLAKASFLSQSDGFVAETETATKTATSAAPWSRVAQHVSVWDPRRCYGHYLAC